MWSSQKKLTFTNNKFFLGLLRSIISTFPIQNFLLLISKVGLVQKDKYSIPGFNVKICTENPKPMESFQKNMKSYKWITTSDMCIMSGGVGTLWHVNIVAFSYKLLHLFVGWLHFCSQSVNNIRTFSNNTLASYISKGHCCRHYIIAFFWGGGLLFYCLFVCCRFVCLLRELFWVAWMMHKHFWAISE